MQYARIEMLFVRGGWSRSTTCAGAVSGPVRGAVVDSTHLVVTRSFVSARIARHLAETHLSADDALGIPADAATLTHKSTVTGSKGPIGHVSRVWVDRASAQVTHVLLRGAGGIFHNGPEYIVEAKRIAAVTSAGIILKPGMDTLIMLPVYRPDADIAADAHLALAGVLADPRARRAVKLHVDDGELMLTGEVDTVEQAHLAEWAVTRVPGVRSVIVDLTAQEQLAHEVEDRIAALGIPAQNGHVPVQVLSEHGIVYLEGIVPNAQWRERVEAAALGAAGARVVVNNLRVAGDTPEQGHGTGPLTRNR